MLDDNDCPMSLWDDNWEKLFLDFSSHREMLTKDYLEMKVDIDGEWVMPTAEMPM